MPEGRVADVRGRSGSPAPSGATLGRGARLAAWVLFLMAGSAILAPCVANDLPYRAVVVDRASFRAARAALEPATSEYVSAAHGQGAAPAAVEERARRRATLQRQLAVLEHWLGDEADLAEVRSLTSAVATGRVDVATLVPRARVLAARLADPLEPVLRARTRWPLFAALSAPEVGLALAWWAALLALLRRRRAAAWTGWAALLVALAWPLLSGTHDAQDRFLKQRAASGELTLEQAWFPPLALGVAETHFEESFRAPTWTPAAEVDDAGRYVRGARSRSEVAGLQVPAVPVDVRPGEPARNAPWRHVLGTDSAGRDVLVRLLWGGRISLTVGLVSALLLVAIGTLFGALAGWCGGWADVAVSRLIEVLQSFPTFVLVLAASALVPADRVHPVAAITLLIALVGWTGVARLVRAEFLRLRGREFVLAARALGRHPVAIVVRHVLPAAAGPVLVAGAFAVAWGILLESAVSFLGFGVRVPVPSWGAILSESRIPEHWWIQLFPGLAIFVTVLCCQRLGEALRTRFDPRDAVADSRRGA